MTDNGRNNPSSPDYSEYVLGADGTPLKDRYGRPVRRRNPGQAPVRRPRRAAEPEPVGQQQFPAVRPDNQTRQMHAEPARPARSTQPARSAQPAQSAKPGQQPPRRYAPPKSKATKRTAPHRHTRKVSPTKRGIGCVLWALITVVVLTLAFVLWTDSRLTRVEALPAEQVPNSAGTNWLLVGSDSRVGLSEEEQAKLGTGGDVGVGRTDTIMLLHIPRSGNAKLVSIPRDSYVSVPGFGEDKINAAFTYGGPQLLTQTVEQATKLRIDHYAEIGMGGLAGVVDAVGGVEMCLDEPIDDPLAGINLPAGCQELDGPNALGYVRTRATPLGDLDRVQRQREFFAALLADVTHPASFINPFRAFSLINSTASAFIVGEGDHVWNLLRVAMAMGSGVETETVPISGFADTEVGNVVLWDEEATAALWDSMR